MHETPARIGLGMIRIHPENESHRAAVREAIARGVRDFDLGFAADPATLARARFLKGEMASPEGARFLVRGELGQAGDPAVGGLFETLSPLLPTWIVSDPEFALARLGGDHRRLYAEIRRDLETLEELGRQGRIAAYGVGSAAFGYSKDDPEFLSATALFEDASGDPLSTRRRFPAFRILEFPFNLYESSPAWADDQLLPDSRLGAAAGTLLEAARALGLETIARRPLSAQTERQLVRLVAYPDHHRIDLDEAVKRTLDVALAEESALIGSTDVPLHWAHRLRRQLVQVNDPEQWKEILRRRLGPELEDAYAALGERGSRYRDAMEALLLSVRLWFEKTAAERNERFRARVAESAPSLRAERDLARAALRIYRSIPGLGCVLVGMRAARQVESLLSPAPAPIPAAEAIAGLETARAAIREFLEAHAEAHADPAPAKRETEIR